MKQSTTYKAIVLAGVMAALAGCGGKSDAELRASARKFLERGQLQSAAIELKSALQQAPQNGETRLLLGEVLLAAGDAVGAEVELRKAKELGHPDKFVLPPLARALLLQRKNKEVISRFATVEIDDPKALADVRTTVAAALGRTGERDRAMELVTSVIKANPDFVPATLLQARITADNGQVDDALKTVQAVIAKDPKHLQALQLEGDLKLYGKLDYDGASEAYQRVIKVKPTHVDAHVALMGIAMFRGNLDTVTKTWEDMHAKLPTSPQTKLFEAQIAYLKQDYAKARDLSQQLLRFAPDHVRTLQIAGAAAYKLNSLAQAEANLARAMRADPEDTRTRKMLAQVYLRSGAGAKALSTLTPSLEAHGNDPELLSMVAESHLQAGDARNAEAFYVRAAKLTPNDPRLRTALAMTAMAKGQAEQALGELQAIATADDGTVADKVLITERLRRGDIAGALKAIEQLERKQPNKPFAPNLRGQVQAQQKDFAAARKSYERAVAVDPLFFPSVAALAALDMQDGKPDAAKKRFDDMLKLDPKNSRALLGIAEVRSKSGANKEEVLKLIEAAITANVNDAAPRVAQVETLLLSRDYKGALSAAQTAMAALPNDTEMLRLLASAQSASGDHRQAIATLGKLATLQPRSPAPHVYMAEAYVAARDNEAAARSLKKALEIAPDLLSAQRSLINLELKAKRPQQALAIARGIQKKRPNDAIGFMLEGDIEAHQRNWDAAIAAQRQGLTKNDPGSLPVRLHLTLVAAKREAEADKFADSWSKGHPDDIVFWIHLADRALAKNDLNLAEQHFRQVLKLSPEHVMALNNVAWLMVKQKRSGAVQVAEKAAALEPKNVAVLETLASAQAAEGQLAKAVETAKQALNISPNAGQLRLSLAKLYIQAGDKAQAKAELQKLAGLGDKFGHQAEVSRLLKDL